MKLKRTPMRRSKWMLFIIIAGFFMAVPGFGLELKIATLSPERSVWMDKYREIGVGPHFKLEKGQ
jgi:hypothetical protein